LSEKFGSPSLKDISIAEWVFRERSSLVMTTFSRRIISNHRLPTEGLLINREIPAGDGVGTESGRNGLPASCRIDPVQVRESSGHRLLVVAQEAVQLMLNNLTRGALWEGNYWRTAGQRLHHHHAEGFIPGDRHQQATSVGQQLCFLGTANLIEVAHLVAVQVRCDLLGKVGLLTRLDRTSKQQRGVGLPGNRDCTMCALVVI